MRLTLLTLASLLALGSSPLLADSIPYANVGQLAPDNSFTASATGNVTAYFYSSDASNDDNFVFTNVTAAPTPEPSSFILFGTGLVGAAGALRRKFARS